MTRGTYTGLNGSQYEQQVGVSSQMGPKGEVAARMAWKWPTGTTEIKSYPSLLVGNKPGYNNAWTTPGGHPVLLLDGTYSQVTPSGKTPGTFFPLQLPIASLKSSFAYKHNETPTGQGHLSYDIWLQETPDQINGMAASPISHEIMIPLTNWGNYGSHIIGRNSGWYDHDVTIDGKLFHVYVAKGADGGVREDFAGAGNSSCSSRTSPSRPARWIWRSSSTTSPPARTIGHPVGHGPRVRCQRGAGRRARQRHGRLDAV